jgi:hypothetical protein
LDFVRVLVRLFCRSGLTPSRTARGSAFRKATCGSHFRLTGIPVQGCRPARWGTTCRSHKRQIALLAGVVSHWSRQVGAYSGWEFLDSLHSSQRLDEFPINVDVVIPSALSRPQPRKAWQTGLARQKRFQSLGGSKRLAPSLALFGLPRPVTRSPFGTFPNGSSGRNGQPASGRRRRPAHPQ